MNKESYSNNAIDEINEIQEQLEICTDYLVKLSKKELISMINTMIKERSVLVKMINFADEKFSDVSQ